MNHNQHNIYERAEIKPFLKWAGGKRWLVSKHPELFPTNFKTYFEPFLGSGAIFFHLQPEKSILADLNEDLIRAYSAIKDDWERVRRYLVEHHRKHSHEYYYKVRQQKLRSEYSKAARLIYLNRTCWNGLYRVNLKGEFNVPVGTKTRVVCKDDCYKEIAQLLQNTELLNSDFETVIEGAQEGDFLFVDPPYTVLHNYNGFIKYNERLFAWEDQIRLRDTLVNASKRGVKFLMTNAYHDSVKALYKHDFAMRVTERNSVISGTNVGRGTYEELLIYSGL
jgi:DNA adenine methylase